HTAEDVDIQLGPGGGGPNAERGEHEGRDSTQYPGRHARILPEPGAAVAPVYTVTTPVRPKRDRRAAPAANAATRTSAAGPSQGPKPRSTTTTPPSAPVLTGVFSLSHGIRSPSHPAETVNPKSIRATSSRMATGMSGMPMIVTASSTQSGANPRRMASPPS